MDMVRLRYFAEVAHHLSLSKAAETLFLSQPALSRHISAFEKELDVPLFERGNRGVKLTAAGELLYAESEALFLNENRLLFRLHELAPSRNQSIRIEFTTRRLISKLTGFLIFYGTKDPEQSFITEQSVWQTLLQNLHRGNTNIGICALNALQSMGDISTRVLFSSPSKICLSRKHPLAKKGSLTIKDLVNDPILLADTTLTADFAVPELLSMAEAAGVELNLCIKHSTVMSILADVALGRGVAPIVGVTWPSDLSNNLSDTVVQLPCEGLSCIDYGVAWNKHMETKRLMDVIDAITEFDWSL